MENDFFVEEQKDDDADQVKEMAATTTYYRYTKEELLDIKELPCSNKRPQCLSERYYSDGVWDPEKWHDSLYPTLRCSSPLDGFNKDLGDDRVPLKCRISDHLECLKEDNLDVHSSQSRCFSGGCQVNADCPISPLENKDESLGGARRIGSGRIIAGRASDREACAEKERERERDVKDKRFRRDFGDKHVFSEKRRNDSYAEEEPEWYIGGPTSQSETIELTGFDDEIVEDDKCRSQMSRKQKVSQKEAEECNGGQAEEPHVGRASTADKEISYPDSLPGLSDGEFDFKFLNLKTTSGLPSMIDVLGGGPGSASRFSQWFSSNPSPLGSRSSSSLRSTPREERVRLSEHKEDVDILEILRKAKIDLKPLLSSLPENKARLHESTNSGMVLSLEEVEGEMKGMKLGSGPQVQKVSPPQRGDGTPFMAEHLEEALTGGSSAHPCSHNPDMSAFNKLVSSMKANGTLPSHPKANSHNPSSDAALVSLPEGQVPVQQQKNIFQELLGGQGSPHSGSPTPLAPLDAQATSSAPLHGSLHKGASSPVFSQRAPSPDYFNSHLQPSSGYPVVPQPMMTGTFTDVHTSISPGPTPQMRALSMAAGQADLDTFHALHAHHPFQTGYNKQPQDKAFQNKQ